MNESPLHHQLKAAVWVVKPDFSDAQSQEAEVFVYNVCVSLCDDSYMHSTTVVLRILSVS